MSEQADAATIANIQDTAGRASATARPARMQAIDLLRGFAVIGMIMVAYAGDWDHRFTVLTHADWHGFALADMIFPSFLFCVGAALPYAFLNRAARGKPALVTHVLRRSAALVLLGVFLNLLPAFDVAHLRLMGILQRIGLCYAIVGSGCVLLGRREAGRFVLPAPAVVAAAALLLAGYGALLLSWDAPGCGRACFDAAHSLPTVVDRALFGVRHLWPYGTTNGVVTYDPEGLLSTLGALVNVLIGVLATLTLRDGVRGPAAWRLAAVGLACLAAGLLLDPWIPVVKKLWTPSFALLSGGFSLLALLALALPGGDAGTAAGATRWRVPVLAFGTNATLAFVGISVLDALMQLPLPGLAGNAHDVAARVLGRLIPEPRIASASYSAALLLALGLVLWQLYRRRIFFKL